MEKWICNYCGRERFDKAKKNDRCGQYGCKGRFKHFAQCKKCGVWFQGHDSNTHCEQCRDKRVGKVELTCAQCGKTFKRYNGNSKGKMQFCDKNCKLEFEKTLWIERTCKECGKKFKICKSTIEHTNASGNYCSRECYWNNMRDERTTKYKGDFERVKREHFSGKQFCAICGITKKIHIHHIIPYRLTHDNSLDNLIPLCATHHVIMEKATKHFVDNTQDYVTAKFMLNVMFRARQVETLNAIIESQ